MAKKTGQQTRILLELLYKQQSIPELTNSISPLKEKQKSKKNLRKIYNRINLSIFQARKDKLIKVIKKNSRYNPAIYALDIDGIIEYLYSSEKFLNRDYNKLKASKDYTKIKNSLISLMEIAKIHMRKLKEYVDRDVMFDYILLSMGESVMVTGKFNDFEHACCGYYLDRLNNKLYF